MENTVEVQHTDEDTVETSTSGTLGKVSPKLEQPSSSKPLAAVKPMDQVENVKRENSECRCNCYCKQRSPRGGSPFVRNYTFERFDYR